MYWEARKARPEQLPDDGDWSVYLYLAGRGAGKTRTAAEWIAWQAVRTPDTRCAVVAATFGDARYTCVEGESGLLAILRRYQMIDEPGGYNRSTGEIKLTNGSLIRLYSAEEPNRLRGPQHHFAWCDELAAWSYPDTYDQLQFGLRLGKHPKTIVTTTPRPTTLIKELLGRSDGSVRVVRGSTFDNAANLPETTLAQLRARYEGTRLGRQELFGEVLEDVEGSLFTLADFDPFRQKKAPELTRIVIGVDPAGTAGPHSDETGIVVVGKGDDGRAYVLADRSCRATFTDWAQRVAQTYKDFEANLIVVEKYGGDAAETILRSVDPLLPIRAVVAKKSKQARAEPVAALYQQGRVSHVGTFNELETQMVEWVPDTGAPSPDRLDALVYAITELGLATGASADRFFAQLAPACEKCGFPTDSGTCRNCGYASTPMSAFSGIAQF